MNIDQLVKGAKTIGISGHIRPDGDCIGSCMGLYLYIKKNFPKIRVDVFLETIPPEFEFIKDIDAVRSDFETDVDSYDLFFSLDCSKDRLGDAEKYFDAAKKTVNIEILFD